MSNYNLQTYDIVFDFRKYDKATVLDSNGVKFFVLAIAKTTDLLGKYYICFMELPDRKLYIEEIKQKNIIEITRNNKIAVADFLHIPDDQEWNSIYNYLDLQGLFSSWQNQSKEEILENA